MCAKYALRSALAECMEGYIAHKRSLGFNAHEEEVAYAPSLDKYLFREGKGEFDKEAALGWTHEASTSESMAGRGLFARGFARYLIEEEDREAYVLPRKATPGRRPSPPPRLFGDSEAGAFFSAADSIPAGLQNPVRHLVVPAYFRLLYSCGLRPREGRVLTMDDVDLENGIVRVLKSKNERDRDVPMAEDVAAMLGAYSDRVAKIFPDRRFFFPGWKADAEWSDSCMRHEFWRCWEQAGVQGFAGPKPVPYSFRHTFATNALRRWKEQGVDIEGNLRVLQEYMGHVDIKSTMYYVHLIRGGYGDATEVPTWEPERREWKGDSYVEI